MSLFRFHLLLLCIFIICYGLLADISSAKEKYKIHPANIVIMKLYPRKHKLKYPWIPRITAQQAYLLYKSGTAFFIHIGKEGCDMAGAMHISQKQAWKLDPNKLFRKLTRYKYVVLYCT